MPTPVSLTTSSTCELTRSSRTWTRPPPAVNLTALDSRFHTHLLQAVGVARDRRRRRGSTIVWMRTPLASAAGCTVATALSTISRQLAPAGRRGGSCPRRSATRPARRRRSGSAQLRVALERSRGRASAFSPRQQPAAQQPRVADDGVQRRPQLVRQHGQELVLQPVGVAGVDVAAARSRARPTPTPAMPSASRSCCSVNTPTREWPKNRPPSTSPGSALHRHGQVAAHRQVALRHAVVRRVLAEARVLR